MSLSDDAQRQIEIFVQQLRKMGTPSSQKDYLVVISQIIRLPTEGIEELVRQSRMLGVGWMVRIADSFLTAISEGDTYRDEDNCLRLKPTANPDFLKNAMGR